MTTSLHIESAVQFSEVNGIPLLLDIYRPSVPKRVPILLLVHGGGWCGGARQDMDLFARYAANAGYLAASVDYRLAPPHPYPAACLDITAAADWLIAHADKYHADPARVGGFGISAGAHLISWLAVQPQSPLTCAVSWAGPMDMLREPVTRPFRGRALAFLNGCEHEMPEAYRSASPLHHVHAGIPPLLLVHGIVDDTVPVDHAHWMAAALQQAGAQVESLLLEGIAHECGTPDDPRFASAWTEVMGFLSRRLNHDTGPL